MFTLILEFGWCGFGWEGGLVPEIRLGLLRIGWCRGSLLDGLVKMRAALKVKVRGVGA